MLSDAVARSSVGAEAVCTASLTTCSQATTLIEASRHTVFWECNIGQYKILLLLLLQYRQISGFVRNDTIELRYCDRLHGDAHNRSRARSLNLCGTLGRDSERKNRRKVQIEEGLYLAGWVYDCHAKGPRFQICGRRTPHFSVRMEVSLETDLA
jgi:hypothetical protein